MNFTPNQLRAIGEPGNVLVLAGAGSGKTSTLVERCVRAVLEDSAGVDEMVVVTFTEAAAAEVRARIRARLDEALQSADASALAERLEKQLALLETAHISTLHSFCLRLVREHFQDLELDPVLVVLPEEQMRLLTEETLDHIFSRHFAAVSADADAVRELVEFQGGSEQAIRQLVIRMHHYSQTLVNPEQWIADQLANFRDPSAGTWQLWLGDAFALWRDQWLPSLDAQPPDHPCAHVFADRLRKLGPKPKRDAMAGLLTDVLAADQAWPARKKGACRDDIAGFFDDAAFLHSVALVKDGRDPLAEDWQWVRRHMETLLLLAVEFARAFAHAKRGQGALDFHDLEQCALRLLLNPKRNGPSTVAEQWRRKIKFVLVDEYQDINAAQDAILRALARERDAGNSFLVGDIKQSIYRFRLADPTIFQNYRSRWTQDAKLGNVIPLSENFRSAQPILDFINGLFAQIMRPEIGGVAYDREARLLKGDADRPLPKYPSVELHLRLFENSREPNDEETSTKSELEARMVAQRLHELHESGQQVWDSKDKQWRIAEWKDMVVLLRSPGPKADVYVREFARAGIPLQAERGGLFESTEISDLLSLLQVLDNPLQDVPLIAVLRSPIVGLTLDELAEVRIAQRHGYFWAALQRWHDLNMAGENARETSSKISGFLQRFSRWRRMGRQSTLSHRLESILNETGYIEWLWSQPRAAQRRANVERFLALAHQFDPFQRQGLQRFLRFVEAQRDAEVDIEPPALENTDAVTLMSIHRSKGLEFPVVVVADLGKGFNSRDLNESVLLDRHYGLCPHVKPPGIGSSYPSLPWWLARRTERRELLGEELRLLYVALTRARDKLLLVGSIKRKSAEESWAENSLTPSEVAGAKCYLDWLGPWCKSCAPADWLNGPEGKTPLFHWKVYDEVGAPVQMTLSMDKEPGETSPEKVRQLIQRIEWRYPSAPATHEPAKLSVSALRERGDDDSESVLQFRPRPLRASRNRSRLSASEVGTAHHLFMQMLDLTRVGSLDDLRAQAQAIASQGLLAADQIESLDLPAIASFWQSEAGRKIAAAAKAVHREIPFTARFTRNDLLEAGVSTTVPEGEFIAVQGTIDLAVILENEIWIADFKTDAVASPEVEPLAQKYSPQLRLYGSALGRIYRRPVTALWLHFFAVSRTLEVKPSTPTSSA